jgi:osmotically inducible protein OsmC
MPRAGKRSRSMPTREAHTTWTGNLQEGTGQIDLVSSEAARFDVSFPRRAADDALGVTSPEELIAAAHSSCYAMQLSALIGEAGAVAERLEVDAKVSLGPDPAGGFRLTGIQLTVRGTVPGMDADGFSKVAAQAKAGCPVSKALTGVEITLDAAVA